MSDKVSFTSFDSKKRVKKVKRKRLVKSAHKTENLLDKVIEAKKLADETINSSNTISLPFIEFEVLQSQVLEGESWNEFEVNLTNSGNGSARNITISFDKLQTRGQTIVDTLDVDEQITIKMEVIASTKDKEIVRMDLYYHSIEGDTFTAVRRDWFPNEYEGLPIFKAEVPPGEEDNAQKYSHKKVFSGELYVVCSKCGVRAPSNFRICGKCGSRLQKRNDRRSDWGSNLNDTTAVQDGREVLIQKLRKLSELKDRGMLTDNEFKAAKSQLLE
jgi:ribosomal protein L40E|tara:strand:- start:315 stop:1133 length:819 start_codon:yes stop_codon:yes gene_type:complete